MKRLKVQKEGDELVPRLRAGTTRIEELRVLMMDEEWPLSDSIKGHITMLLDGTTLLEQLLTKTEQEIEPLTARFAKQISDAVPQLNKEVAATRQELDDAIIADPDADETEVLSHLYAQKEAYDRHKATAEKCVVRALLLRAGRALRARRMHALALLFWVWVWVFAGWQADAMEDGLW